MANTDTPKGLVPVAHRNGAPYNGAATVYYVPSTYATAIFIGDAVVKTGTSNTAKFEEWDIATLPEVNRAGVGDAEAITGVVVAVGMNRDDLSKQYHAASTAGIVWVADDPDLLFEIQADGAVPAASIGLNAVLIDTHSGSTITGISGTELDTTSTAPGADASYQLTIQRSVNRTDNTPNLLHNKVLVKINNHTEAHGVIGL